MDCYFTMLGILDRREFRSYYGHDATNLDVPKANNLVLDFMNDDKTYVNGNLNILSGHPDQLISYLFVHQLERFDTEWKTRSVFSQDDSDTFWDYIEGIGMSGTLGYPGGFRVSRDIMEYLAARRSTGARMRSGPH